MVPNIIMVQPPSTASGRVAESWCLCHGICGNLWILEKASEILGRYLSDNCFFREEAQLLPQEKVNPGLMNGYGGILRYLLQKQ